MAQSLVAIVTGGAQGLGAAIVETLLNNGHKVMVADLQKEKGEQFAKQLQQTHGPKTAAFVKCDVTKEDDYRNAFECTVKQFSRIDVVINNAGIVDEHNYKRSLEVNLAGPIIGCQLAFEYLGKSKGGSGGIVISTASLAGLVPSPRTPVYAATKHGVVGLTRSFGTTFHFERDGIVFTALCPSFIDTPIFDNCRDKSAWIEYDPRTVHDLMTPEFVAKAVLKLLEDRKNGSVLLVTKEKGYDYVGYQEIVEDFAMLTL